MPSFYASGAPMMTLDQAIERLKYPISVRFLPPLMPSRYSDGVFVVSYMDREGDFVREYSQCHLDARQDYLTAIKELESQYVPGVVR